MTSPYDSVDRIVNVEFRIAFADWGWQSAGFAWQRVWLQHHLIDG
jgi:hypothetical protein